MNDGMLKGKDIKQQGDCLVHCFIKKIEVTGSFTRQDDARFSFHDKPEDFEKW